VTVAGLPGRAGYRRNLVIVIQHIRLLFFFGPVYFAEVGEF